MAGSCPANNPAEAYARVVAAWTRSWCAPAVVSWFHAGSACFTLGLLGAIYFRGLFTGYLAGWESTWLDARGVSAFLEILLCLLCLLCPASRITGIPLPGSNEGVGAPAAHALAKQGANLGIAVLPFGFKNPATIRSLMETQFREILDHLYPNSRLPEKSSRRRDGSCALPGFPAILGRVRIRPCRSMAVVHPVFQNPRAGGGRLRDRQAQAQRPSAEARLAGAGG
jgi:hypothetical protein